VGTGALLDAVRAGEKRAERLYKQAEEVLPGTPGQGTAHRVASDPCCNGCDGRSPKLPWASRRIDPNWAATEHSRISVSRSFSLSANSLAWIWAQAKTAATRWRCRGGYKQAVVAGVALCTEVDLREKVHDW